MEPEFTYTAFISYSHRGKDKKFAERLHRYLEHYKMPSILCQQFAHIPKNLRPVFIDTEELGIDDLKEELHKALAASRCLIVVCSENSIKPNAQGINWVEHEVRTFISLRPENAKRVIPIILREDEGVSARECLLPIIQEHGILGADILTKGKERVFNDVVAKIAGLKPDTLWKRHERVLRHRRRLQWLGGAVAAALTAVASWGAWYYYTPHVSYYTDYVERNNIPEGLFPLNEEQVKTRHRHYRFTEHKLRLRKVEYCNSAGMPREHRNHWDMERSANMELHYKEDGSVSKCVHRDAQGWEERIRVFSPNRVDFKQTKGIDQIEVAQSVSLNINLASSKNSNQQTGIDRFAVTRSQHEPHQGIVTRELYRKAATDITLKDDRGFNGRAYELDTLGRPIVILNLVELPSGEVEAAETPQGIAGYRLSYGNDGQVCSIVYINKEGQAVLNQEKWAELRIRYDAQGNVQETSLHGVDGELCPAHGYAQARYRHDEHGNTIERSLFGIDGKPCIPNGYTRITYAHDNNGNVVEEAYHDLDGKPGLVYGYARTIRRFDARGNMLEEAYFGRDGKLCRVSGYARERHEYNELGHSTRKTKFDLAETPAAGYARAKYTYDESGNLTAETYEDSKGNQCFLPVARTYDKQGNMVEMVQGNANYNIRTVYTYDKRGNLIKEAYGRDGKPCLNHEGRASLTRKYDEHGNMVEEAYFGVDDKPLPGACSFARLTREFDKHGNMLEEAYFDANGRPCLHSGKGYARISKKYDERCNQQEEAYFGIDELPCVNKEGIARIIWRYGYDERGKTVEEAYFGVDGKPCLNQNGVARAAWRLDKRGNEEEIAYFGVDDNPCLSKSGIARISRRHDERGNTLEEAYYGADGKPALLDGYARITKQYDALNRPIEIAYYGADGLPSASGGYARITRKYAPHGPKARDAYSAETDDPSVVRAGHYLLPSRDMVVEEAYYGADGKPCIWGRGACARITRQYDQRGNIREIAFFGVDGKPCLNLDGYARHVYEYSREGKPLLRISYDAEGKEMEKKHLHQVQILSAPVFAFRPVAPTRLW